MAFWLKVVTKVKGILDNVSLVSIILEIFTCISEKKNI